VTLSWQHVTYKPSKLGQTDLVFGVRPEFTSRSVHGKNEYKSLHLAVDLCHPG